MNTTQKDPATILRKGGTLSLFINSFGVVLAFLLQISLARTLSLEGFGFYSYALSWLSVLLLVGGVGFEPTMLRFVPIYVSQGEWGKLRGLLLHSSVVVVWGSLLVGGGVAVVATLLDTPSELRSTFVVGALLLPVWGLNVLRQATLRGLKAVAAARVPDIIVRPLFFIGLLWVVGSSFSGLTANLAMMLHLMAAIVALLLGSVWQFDRLPKEIRTIPAQFDRSEWYAVSVPLLAIGLLSVLSQEVDKILLGTFLGAEEVGLYAAASRLSYFVLFGLDAVLAIGAPMIAEVHAAHDKESLQRLLHQTTRFVSLLALPLVALLVGAGGWLLTLFGEAFILAYPILVILVVANTAHLVFGPVGFALNMTGHQRENLRILLFSTIAQALLVAVGVLIGGLLGAAVGIAIGNFARSYLLWRRCTALLGIDIGVIAALRVTR